MPAQQRNTRFGKGFQGAVNRNNGGGFRLGNSRTGPDSALAQNAPAISISQNPEGWVAPRERRTDANEARTQEGTGQILLRTHRTIS